MGRESAEANMSAYGRLWERARVIREHAKDISPSPSPTATIQERIDAAIRLKDAEVRFRDVEVATLIRLRDELATVEAEMAATEDR